MTLWGDWGEFSFWLAAGGMTFLVAGLMIVALIKGRARDVPTAAYDLQVYRDQLREVEKDLARGTITEDEAKRVRTEVSRRVLEADRALAAGDAPRAAPAGATWGAGVGMVVLCLGAIWLYTDVGTPGYPDLPIKWRLAEASQLEAHRPGQAEAEAEAAKRFATPPLPPQTAQLMEQLRAAVAKRPDDLKGAELLMQNEAGVGNFGAAWKAAATVIRLKGDKADAEDYARQGDLMAIAAGGYVSPAAQKLFEKALSLDPGNGTARYFMGVMHAQTGRPDLGFQIWEKLMRDSKPDAPWLPAIRGQIAQMAQMAGIRYQLPPQAGADGMAGALPGPSAADMKAAQDMTPAQRQEMIRGMVQGLAERLNADGGSAAEWARLIGAYGVLGEDAKKAEALARARAAYKDQPEALAQIEAAAKRGPMPGMGGAAPAPAPAQAPTQAPAPAAPEATPPAGAMSTAPATPPVGLPQDGTQPAPQGALPGPSAADVKAAQDMSPADRQQMIQGMVQRLNDKLATQGGTAAEWARLIGAYGVLGDKTRAQAIYDEAKTHFGTFPDQMALIRAAGEKAGVTP